jgi:peptidoglycan/xylan/chitin deacetylase (PgdA/CDA1 family)
MMLQRLMAVGLVVLVFSGTASAGVVERLPDDAGRVVALTFDACQTKTPSVFDEGILAYLLAERLPATIFVSGSFIRNGGNRARVAALARTGLLTFENHADTHPHFPALAAGEVAGEVERAGALIAEVTGRRPRLFRFPYGEFTPESLAAVERLGYRVVHWTYPSGDPDPNLTARELAEGVVRQATPGAILIFHVNGRGWKTAEALPRIVAELRRQGYRFVPLDF